MKKAICLILFLAGTTLSVFAQEPDLMDLEKAVLTGLERNFGLKIAANNVAMAERDVKIGVGSFFMPRFDAAGLGHLVREDVEQTFVSNPENPVKILGANPITKPFRLWVFMGLGRKRSIL
jgi:outer membrane protein